MKKEKLEEALMNKYGYNNWTKITQEKMEYNNILEKDDNEKDVLLNGEITWTAFSSPDAGNVIFTFDNGQDIILITRNAFLPPKYFEYGFYNLEDGEDSASFFIQFNDKIPMVETEIYSDDLDLRHVAGLAVCFEDLGLEIFCEMENIFSVNYIEESTVFDPVKLGLDIALVLSKLGISHSPSLQETLE